MAVYASSTHTVQNCISTPDTHLNLTLICRLLSLIHVVC